MNANKPRKITKAQKAEMYFNSFVNNVKHCNCSAQYEQATKTLDKMLEEKMINSTEYDYLKNDFKKISTEEIKGTKETKRSMKLKKWWSERNAKQ